MKNLVTKKSTLFITGVLTPLLIAWDYIGNYRICDNITRSGSAGDCPFILSDIELVLFPILPLFFFSLITYKMRDETYQSWFRFAKWWIPLSIFSILIAPSYGSDWMFPIDKGRVAFFMSLLFTLISVALIAYKYFALRKKR